MFRTVDVKRGDNPSELHRNVSEMLQTYPEVKVQIQPKYPIRTHEQNNLFQLLVSRLSMQSGESKNTIKLKVKDIALGLGYPYNERYEPKSSAQVDVAEFKLLIEACHIYANEHGFILESTQNE